MFRTRTHDLSDITIFTATNFNIYQNITFSIQKAFANKNKFTATTTAAKQKKKFTKNLS